MSGWVWLAVAAVGGGGAIGRFLLDSVVSGAAGRDFPLGTFAVNLSGALLLGFLTGAALTGNLMVVVGTATIGSYSTFSTWMLETQRLAEDTEMGRAGLNLAVSLLAGFGAAALGHAIGAHV
ncbi:MAG TPA: fluoride efflux transporter CrcB [Solirubrobacteraceae bacterium]|nr:fluoride efflux transporter CrcB [Solirubrobacteraceae bacterium]